MSPDMNKYANAVLTVATNSCASFITSGAHMLKSLPSFLDARNNFPASAGTMRSASMAFSSSHDASQTQTTNTIVAVNVYSGVVFFNRETPNHNGGLSYYTRSYSMYIYIYIAVGQNPVNPG